MVRNTLRYVSYKDMKAFASGLKLIYWAHNEESALNALAACEEKWGKKYPLSMQRWSDSWDETFTIFKYSEVTRRIIYTTNAIESLNSAIRRLNRQRSVFPGNKAVIKSVWLAIREHTKKCYSPDMSGDNAATELGPSIC